MTKEFLDNIENLSKEVKSIEKRLKQIEEKEHTTIADSVQTSSKTFPFTKHSTVVYGVPYNPRLKNKYKKMMNILSSAYDTANSISMNTKLVIRKHFPNEDAWYPPTKNLGNAKKKIKIIPKKML